MCRSTRCLPLAARFVLVVAVPVLLFPALAGAVEGFNNGNRSAASSGFNQLRNEFLTAVRRVATAKKQAIGEVVEPASGSTFKYGDIGRMAEADTPTLRAATELTASALAGARR